MTPPRPRPFILLIALALGGCEDAQSVLSPHGPLAADIASLAWLLFATALAVLVIVLACLLLALRGTPPLRSWLSGNGAIYLGGVALPVVVLSALLTLSLWITRESAGQRGPPAAARVEVTGEQWWWRVAYVGADATRIESANEIRMPAGREMEFRLLSADVIHSFWVPNLGGKVDMVPGHTNTLRLLADAPGSFRGQCAEYCGGPHALMALRVVAMPAEDFDAWLAAQSRPAAEPEDEAGGRGRALFLAAGCGGCHTVRGTAATGTAGPDLTHFGSRGAIAAETLPLTKAHVAQFVTHAGASKPGIHMPPFLIFSQAEIDALAGYLVGLR